MLVKSMIDVKPPIRLPSELIIGAEEIEIYLIFPFLVVIWDLT